MHVDKHGLCVRVTRTGRFVLETWSQWQQSRPSWAEIGAVEAAEWLVRNNHDPDDLPAAAAKLVEEQMADAEI